MIQYKAIQVAFMLLSTTTISPCYGWTAPANIRQVPLSTASIVRTINPNGITGKTVSSKLVTDKKTRQTKSMSQLYAIAIPLDGNTSPTPPPPTTTKTSSSSDHYDESSTRGYGYGDELDPQDAWIAKLDYEAFGREVTQLGKDIVAATNAANGSSSNNNNIDDANHLNQIILWRNIAAIVGIGTMWISSPNPVSVLALSTWTYASWAMIGHHTLHGGYNRIDANNINQTYNSRTFASGSIVNRIIDWLDWMLPEAWNIEHNRLHHYRLNENYDPDLVQRNMNKLRDDTNMSLTVKTIQVLGLACVWKWFYYAPNTYKEYQINKYKSTGTVLPNDFIPTDSVVLSSLLFSNGKEYDALRQVVNPIEFITKVLGPFFLLRYVLLPGPLLLIPGIGQALFTNALINLILAEIVTNIHSFVTIVTNHAGDDLYTFHDSVKPKSSSFYVRQIVGSVNYNYGTNIIDFAHGYLNYQIEHHVYPDLTMLQYQKVAPLLKEICDRHNVPYIQQNVFERLKKTIDIMIGKTSMRTFPTQYEPISDKVAAVAVGGSTTSSTTKNEEG